MLVVTALFTAATTVAICDDDMPVNRAPLPETSVNVAEK
jgi:hypothetical protein